MIITIVNNKQIDRFLVDREMDEVILRSERKRKLTRHYRKITDLSLKQCFRKAENVIRRQESKKKG